MSNYVIFYFEESFIFGDLTWLRYMVHQTCYYEPRNEHVV